MTRRLTRRLTRPAAVVALTLLGVLVIVASGSRSWVTGRTADAVLGAASVSATGSEAVAGLVALALAAAAAAVAAVTAGRIGRWVAVVAFGLVGVGLAVELVRFVADPGLALGRVAARQLGRTGTLDTTATLGGWTWVAGAGVILVLAAAALAAVGARTWGGLGRRYESSEPDASGPRGQRVRSDWDRLDAGEDPTEPVTPGETAGGAETTPQTGPI